MTRVVRISFDARATHGILSGMSAVQEFLNHYGRPFSKMIEKSGKASNRFQDQALLKGRIVSCIRCPRLAAFLESHRQEHPDWHCRPVPGFGDPRARLLVIGLAPGLQGANRTGRPFTGDAAGVWLYRVLHELGLASRPDAVSRGDGLGLRDVYIANAVKCVPPGNKPDPSEIRNCRPHLEAELAALRRVRVVLCLGRIAHDAYIAARRERETGLRPADFPFGHAAVHSLPSRPETLVDSFHPSRQNTNTGRLTREMWQAAFTAAMKPFGSSYPRSC